LPGSPGSCWLLFLHGTNYLLVNISETAVNSSRRNVGDVSESQCCEGPLHGSGERQQVESQRVEGKGVLVQPEVERGRSPLVSNPPLGQDHCSSTTSIRINFRLARDPVTVTLLV